MKRALTQRLVPRLALAALGISIILTPIGVGINSHGLRFDRDAQAVHVRGHAIPGFYVVGNSAALIDIGGGYQSGMSNLRAITWGYIAGKHAAARKT